MKNALEKQGHRFADRHDAGRHLADALKRYARKPDVVVLALPRGGVPVAYQVATSLGAPLDVFEVRKLGVPGHEELAMGAIGSGGAQYLREDLIESLHIPPDQITAAIQREHRELERREKVYRDSRPRPQIAGKTIILVDDGVATGATMHVAISALREQKPARIVVGLPVASIEACEDLRREADEVVCWELPDPFWAVGVWYVDFRQVTDDEVRTLLNQAAERNLS